jgi:hypothetical protein
MAMLPVDEVVEALGVPHRSRAAFWRLVELGADAVPAVRSGLRNKDARVRRGCCEFLDLYWDDESADAVLGLVDDPHPDVRWMAGHALSCERGKKETWSTRPRVR